MNKSMLALSFVGFLTVAVTASANAAGAAGAAATGAGGQAGGGGGQVISSHGQTVTLTLKGGLVRITGDANTVTLKGKVDTLIVGGDENGVRVEKVKMIWTKGDGNLVKWKEALPPLKKPGVKDTGDHNTIQKDDGGSITPPTNPAMDKTNAAKTGEN